MKLLYAVATLSLISSSAFSADLRKANLYTCKARDVSVSLATSSLRGEPQLTIAGKAAVGQSFSETELATTPRGLEASVFVTNINDASQTYTLIVPEVMIENVQATAVNGILIQTMAGGLINPELVPGPIQRNTVQTVKCEAQAVNF